jgi:hypothetical protein
MKAFSDAVVDLFADENLGCDALYRAGGLGDGVMVRLILWDADERQAFIETQAIVRNVSADVQLREVANPAIGDTFAITGAATYRIKAKPMLDRTAGTARLSLESV